MRDGYRVSAYDRSPPGQASGLTATGNGSGFTIKLDGGISDNSAQHLGDIATAKDALFRLGHYQYPTFVENRADAGFMDGSLGPAIRSFQRDNGLKVDGRMTPDGETVRKINEMGKNSHEYNIGKVVGEAVYDVQGTVGYLVKNYFDMKESREIGSDDYFHCKANYDATKRGKAGEFTSILLGNFKEDMDFVKNVTVKGLSAKEAYDDFHHDLNVNRIGRERAKSGKYSSSKEGCSDMRPNTLDKKW